MQNDQNVPDNLNYCNIKDSVGNYANESIDCFYNVVNIKKQALYENHSYSNKSNNTEKTNELKQCIKPVDTPAAQKEDKTKLISSSQADSIIYKEILEEASVKKKIINQELDKTNSIKNVDDHVSDLRHKNTMKRDYCEDNESPNLNSGTKRCKPTIVTDKEMRYFFNLLENENIQDFLDRDKCCLISDKVN